MFEWFLYKKTHHNAGKWKRYCHDVGGRATARCRPFLTTRKIDMTINKALLALAMGFALAACSNQQQAGDSAADAADAAAAAQTAADEAAAAGSMTADVAPEDRKSTRLNSSH